MTRQQVARYLAEHTAAGRSDAVRRAAAWLADTGRSREVNLLAIDTAKYLANDGYIYARVTTARKLNPEAEDNIIRFLKQTAGARQVELHAVVDPSLVGGLRLETPMAELDASIRHKLKTLAEGVYR